MIVSPAADQAYPRRAQRWPTLCPTPYLPCIHDIRLIDGSHDDTLGAAIMTTASPDTPYQNSADYLWTERAFEMLERYDLHGEVVSRDKIVGSRVWGPCPRCGHILDDRQTHTAVTNLMGRERRPRGATGSGQVGGNTDVAFFAVDVSCGCGSSHSGAPADKTGCGVSFRVELPVRVADR